MLASLGENMQHIVGKTQGVVQIFGLIKVNNGGANIELQSASIQHDTEETCKNTADSCHDVNTADLPLTRPTARAVVQPSVQYVTDITAAISDTSAKELKFGNCTDMLRLVPG